MSNQTLTFNDLRRAVDDAAAVRAITALEPAGGPSDKVFPPTYSVGKSAATQYAVEKRRVAGEVVDAVLLDSVASQANRMELALLAAYRDGDLEIPLVEVDFFDELNVDGEHDLADIATISSLEAPHRIADAILRDSLLDGELFRTSRLGRSFVNAKPRNAGAMYNICPHALVFGVWDSTGPLGGLGAKFQRVLVSEIVGYGEVRGVKTKSRIDPLSIQKGVSVYEAKDAAQAWTLEVGEAKRKSNKPVTVGKEGKPSEINHSNITPSIESQAGGVTLDRAEQVTVLSLTGLRQLHFPISPAGEIFEGEARGAAERAARTVLAALGIAALVFARRDGFHLRSRAVLVPKGPLVLEIISADGEAPRSFSISRAEVISIFRAAVAEAEAAGMAWHGEKITLKPAPKLANLVRQSRALAAAGEADDAAGEN